MILVDKDGKSIEECLENTKNLAGFHWDNIHEVYNMAKD